MLGAIFRARNRTPLRAARWVVVDCESSGLDPRRDRLIAVGGVAVESGRIDLGSGFSEVLAQAAPSMAQNILVHGIGAHAQRNGLPAREALTALAVFMGDGIPVAFHAAFDAALLDRAMPAEGLVSPRGWLDAAQLAPALFPQARPARGTHRSLDDWLAHFGIACAMRHDALADAYATAQMLLVLFSEAARQGAATVDDLHSLARAGRWIPPG